MGVSPKYMKHKLSVSEENGVLPDYDHSLEWVDSTDFDYTIPKKYKIDGSGRLYVYDEVIGTDGDEEHNDPRLSGFGATKGRTKEWVRTYYTGFARLYSDNGDYKVLFRDGVCVRCKKKKKETFKTVL